MAVISTCPECDSKISVPESLLGKKVKCTRCQAIFVANPKHVDESPAAAPPPPNFDIGDERFRESRPSEFRDEPPGRPRSQYEPDRPSRRMDDDFDDFEDDRRRRRRRREYDDEFLKPNRSGNILTMGLLSNFVGLCICGPAGIAMGINAINMANEDEREIAAGRMDPSNSGTITTGKVFGIIGVVVSVLAMVVGFGIMLAG